MKLQAPQPDDLGALLRESFSVATHTDNLVPLLVDGLLVVVLSACTFGFAAPPLLHGYTAMCMRATRGQKLEVGESFAGISRFTDTLALGLACLAVLVVTSIVPVVGTFLGACGVWWAFCAHVDNPSMGALDALKHSVALTRARPFETALVAALGLGLHAVFAATAIGLVLTTAFVGVLTAVTYQRFSRALPPGGAP